MDDLKEVFEVQHQANENLFAALDLGSNSFHLVIARVDANALQIVSKVKQKVRLAEGLNEHNELSDEAIFRGIGVLEGMLESLQGIPASAIRVVATHTLRRAINAHEFLTQAASVFPWNIEIISGNEEARLIFVGVSSVTDNPAQRLVFDIGGGSTEFAIGDKIQPKITKSIQMGCVSYQKAFFADGVIDQANTNKAITSAKLSLDLATSNLKRFNWQHCIGSSGTAKAICTAASNRFDKPFDTPVDYASLRQLLSECIEMGSVNALEIDGISQDRRDVFVPGLCIMIGIFESLGISEFSYSDAALREGVLYELQPTHNSQSVRVTTAQSLATRYNIDTQYAQKVMRVCMTMFENVSTPWQLHSELAKHLLGWSALLHEVGLQIHSRGIQKHSSYILQNSELPGFTQQQQQIIALLVRFHRKKVRIEDIPVDSLFDQQTLIRLLVILRLAILLNINRPQNELPDFTVEAQNEEIKLGFAQDWFELSPLLIAELRREASYLKNLNINLSLL